MRQVARRLQERAGDTEHILCASDPDSLDAVVFPKLRLAIADGTPPHVLEPAYIGAVERYLPLCNFTDFTGIERDREEIIRLNDLMRDCHAQAYTCLTAVRALRDSARNLLADAGAEEKAARRAEGVIAREIRRRDGAGSLRVRFLNAYTPRGALCLYDSAESLCPRLYDIQDSAGLAHPMLNAIQDAALCANHDVIACRDPLRPERELLHVLIPSLGLGFVTSNADCAYAGTPYRRVRLDAYLPDAQRRAHRGRLRFLGQTERALTAETVQCLAQAKGYHDELEALYRPYVDMDAVLQAAETFAAALR
jgi:hypothetical protein